MPMYVDLKVGESLSIDKGKVTLTLQEKSGQLARLRVDADKTISVEKNEAADAYSQARKGIAMAI